MSETTKSVGIWVPVKEGREKHYIRDVNKVHAWRSWANVHLIPSKSEAKRIILLGESVARGYFFDPYYNPAGELQQVLRSVNGLEQAEVIDLAKNGLLLSELQEISADCLELAPDSIVIFAGNNWNDILYQPGFFSREEQELLTAAFTRFDFPTVKQLLEKKLYTAISELLHHIKGITATGVKVIFVIPEFNLGAWTSNSSERTVLFQFERVGAKWISARKAAEEFLQLGLIEQAAAQAGIMISLDSSNPLGYELAARCKLAQQDHEAARSLLQTARDTAVFSKIVNYAPRCHSACRQTILDGEHEYGYSVVDLPELFKEHLEGKLPGREMFMDYCHLTVKGIKIAMQSTARLLVPLLLPGSAAAPAASALMPDASVTEMAHTFAAVHCSRFGQSNDLLRYHCECAVQNTNTASRFMALFVSMAARRASSELTSHYEEIVLKNMAGQYMQGIGMLHAPRKKVMHTALVESMVAALKNANVDMHVRLNQLLEQEHAADNFKINLLQTYYRQSYHSETGLYNNTYYKAPDEISCFQVITKGIDPVLLTVVCRLPYHQQLPVMIYFNDHKVAEITADGKWKTHKIIVSAAVQVKGINRLSFHWPVNDRYCTACHTRPFADEKVPFLNSLYKPLYPLFGEIHMLTAEKAVDILS